MAPRERDISGWISLHRQPLAPSQHSRWTTDIFRCINALYEEFCSDRGFAPLSHLNIGFSREELQGWSEIMWSLGWLYSVLMIGARVGGRLRVFGDFPKMTQPLSARAIGGLIVPNGKTDLGITCCRRSHLQDLRLSSLPSQFSNSIDSLCHSSLEEVSCRYDELEPASSHSLFRSGEPAAM